MLAPPTRFLGHAIEVIATKMGILGIGGAVFVDPGRKT